MSGSFLVCLTNLRTIIGPGAVHRDGRNIPIDDRHWKIKNFSCGVELVDVECNLHLEALLSIERLGDYEF